MIEIINCAQGSSDWFSARIGSIGGSSIASVTAGGQGKMRKSLLYRLAGEILSGVKYEGYRNADMDRGIEQESDARNVYAMEREIEVQQVGLVKLDEFRHCSPDGLIGTDGMIEIKSTIPSVHIETIDTGKIDGGYIKQMMWGLHICEKDWADFISWSPLVTDYPIWIKRVERDEKLIKDLNDGADKFIDELKSLVLRIKDLTH
uniref:Putative exonuclease n=1 Tax=viral metagenome TaxID=1070528 RepID=A0A6M3LQT6_9ZZZZ